MLAVQCKTGVAPLLEHSAAPNQIWPKQTTTPQHIALTNEDTDTVPRLLEKARIFSLLQHILKDTNQRIKYEK